jgi:hypothetical protein
MVAEVVTVGILTLGSLALLIATTRIPRLRPLSWFALLVTVGLLVVLVVMLAGPVAFWLMGLT